MLVLSRRVRESIVIGNNITVTLVEVRGNKVKLGIDAPPEVPVHRQEIANAIIANEGNETVDKGVNNQTLLVVSNNSDTRSSIAGMLAAEGGEVDTADSSTCALEYSKEKEYDVAIIDEALRHARGRELFAQMKSHQRGLKGILCSNRPTVVTVEAALGSGMQHVIQKPINQQELISLVGN